MTLKELYAEIEGDYDQALKVLRIEKLLDKHIRKLPANGIFLDLIDAGKSMEPSKLFESSHAVKGVCSNLGLVKMAGLASEISEEFRPGNPRRLSDEEVRAKLAEFSALYEKTVAGVRRYEQSLQ